MYYVQLRDGVCRSEHATWLVAKAAAEQQSESYPFESWYVMHHRVRIAKYFQGRQMPCAEPRR